MGKNETQSSEFNVSPSTADGLIKSAAPATASGATNESVSPITVADVGNVGGSHTPLTGEGGNSGGSNPPKK